MTHRLAVALRASFKEVLRDDISEDSKLQIAAAVESLKEIDPRRLKGKGQKKDGSFDLLESCSRGDGATSDTDKSGGDMWDDPTRASDEFFRLNDVDRQFTQFVRGEFVLRPGADMREFILKALDGREPSVENFTTLYRYVSMRGGPLRDELGRILRDQGALPPFDPAVKTYGELLLEELEARN